jgi:lytic murein transglycosylase
MRSAWTMAPAFGTVSGGRGREIRGDGRDGRNDEVLTMRLGSTRRRAPRGSERARRFAAAMTVGAGLMMATPALAAMPCETGDFNTWLADFGREATSLGVGPQAVSALNGLTYDKKVIGLDRNQKHFKVSFEEFIKNRVSGGRITKGRQMLKKHAELLARIEKDFGVPPQIIVAIWGMETDYGVVLGKMPAIRSLATLAYDCRRTDFFQQQLFDALRVIDRGDITPAEMRGAWAGEIGQTQFMATSYYRYALDYDGDGRRDLVNSVPDVLGSTANFLKGHGWVRGAGYHPDEPNYAALQGWNKANIYSRALGYFADKLVEGS